MSDYNINALAIPLFLVFMLLEYALLHLKGQKRHRLNDSVASLSMGMLLLISDALLKAYTFAVFIYLFDQHRLFDFSPYAPITWLLFFFAVDLCYYWFHRCAHQFNFLWGAHVGHHQSEEYNLTTALRQSAFQYAFSWVFYLPLALLGCPPQVFLILFILLKLYQFWLHTELIKKLPRPIEYIFTTPSHHRVHHATNEKYLDKNYGSTLIIWDRIFGTFKEEEETPDYGILKPVGSYNPVYLVFHEAIDIVKDLSTYRSPKAWWKILFGSPNLTLNKKAYAEAAGLPVVEPKEEEATAKVKAKVEA